MSVSAEAPLTPNNCRTPPLPSEACLLGPSLLLVPFLFAASGEERRLLLLSWNVVSKGKNVLVDDDKGDFFGGIMAKKEEDDAVRLTV